MSGSWMLGIAVAIVGSVAASGCARIAFYDDPKQFNSDHETGIKIYQTKPYLMVVRTGNKDTPIQGTIIYLPDMKDPVYAKAWSGIGTSNLQITLSNGILSTVGQTVDSKVPETMTAIGSMISSLASAAETGSGVYHAQGTDMGEQAKLLQTTKEDMKRQVDTARTHNLFSVNVLNAIFDPAKKSGVVRQLDDAYDLLNAPGAEAHRDEIVTLLTQAADQFDKIDLGEGGSGEAQNVRTILKNDMTVVGLILKKLTGGDQKPPAPPIVQLYEIDNSSGKLVLTPVQIPGLQ
ncbi:hypothetical protein FRZ44_49200 [Hypericibacter terrae]|uniref:Uncharacterized protein n=1 Tax=Hypericibacter terrae TaxID=2602015 RepID=A0A5J6MSE2_9PROT|nr:hypothetical protein [Hypericibacter terrae]QEX19605.1 hypothetical protein FRZ44_49200 [Hypericibacter terrae]